MMGIARATFMSNPDGQFPGSFTICLPKDPDTDRDEIAFKNYYQVGKEVNFNQKGEKHSGTVQRVDETDWYIFVTVRMREGQGIRE